MDFYAKPDDPGRRLFYEMDLKLLREPGAAHSAAHFHLKAVLCEAFDEPEQAVMAYQAALDRQPLATQWRYGLARLLHRLGRLKEARSQLSSILATSPTTAKGGGC